MGQRSSTMSDENLELELEGLRESHISLLQDFVRIDSSNPPGDTRQACKYLTEHLTKAGIAYNVYAPQEKAPNIVATFQGRKGDGAHILLNGHIDVFPTGPRENWDRDPLSGDNIGGLYIHGRGTVDMKSGSAAILAAFCLLYRHRNAMKGRLTLTLVSDEETGGKWGSNWLIKNKPAECRGDILLNSEPGGLQSIRFGEKGTLRMTATIRTKGAMGPYLNISKGANRIGVEFVNKIITRVEALRPSLPEKLRKHLESDAVKKAADEIMGEGASKLFVYPTVNVGVWQGGLKVNMIPSSAEIQLDVRMPIGMVKKDVFDVIDDILKDFPEITVTEQEAASNPSNMCDEDHPIVRCFAQEAERIVGIKPVSLPGLGGTDAKHWRYAGIPAYTYGLSPLTMASNSERVSLKEYISLIKVYVSALNQYMS
jgi:succinyl-diaminopimelate desuccinylase